MKSALTFLIAAKRAEVAALRHGEASVALVASAASLVHALQRERGLSVAFLSLANDTALAAYRAQSMASEQSAQDLRLFLDQMDSEAVLDAYGARLNSRVARVLLGLDALPWGRSQVELQRWGPAQAHEGYSKLVSVLLKLVFDAADVALDPQMSRLLVAMFNLMQGKEFAGQERATGTALLAGGGDVEALRLRLRHLAESQERCLQVFESLAPECVAQSIRGERVEQDSAALESMRRVLAHSDGGHETRFAGVAAWFDTCTRRIDSLRQAETDLSGALVAHCAGRLRETERELVAYQQHERALRVNRSVLIGADAASFFKDEGHGAPDAFGVIDAGLGEEAPVVSNQPISALVRQQAQRLSAAEAELERVRASLNERKVVERAKGLLMSQHGLSEDLAYRRLRQSAMSQNRRIIDVAQAVVALAHVFADTPPNGRT